MAKPLSYQLDCKRGFWAAAHLNKGHVFKHSLQSPKGALSSILNMEVLSSPELPLPFALDFRLWPNAQISSSWDINPIRKEASALGVVLFW